MAEKCSDSRVPPQTHWERA